MIAGKGGRMPQRNGRTYSRPRGFHRGATDRGNHGVTGKPLIRLLQHKPSHCLWSQHTEMQRYSVRDSATTRFTWERS
jgi:hypothetical protein